MTDPQPFPDAPTPAVRRTVRRIVAEALLILLLGTFAVGTLWEMGFPDTGWVVALIIWICGAPALEIMRVFQRRH